MRVALPRPPRSRFALFVLASAIAACGNEATVGDDPGSSGETPPPGSSGETPPSTTCTAAPRIESAKVADARGKEPFTLVVDMQDSGGMRGGHPLKVVLTKSTGEAVATLHDAPVELGKVTITLPPAATRDLATGHYALQVEAGCPAGATSAVTGKANADLFLVRFGVTSVDVKAEAGARVDLMYHAVNGDYGSVLAVTDALATSLAVPEGESEIDDAKGARRAFAAPWKELDTPPVDANGTVEERGHTMPVSLVVGTKPDLVFTIGKTAQGVAGAATQPTGLEQPGLPAVRLVVDGTPGDPAQKLVPGETVTVRLATSPVPSIARVDSAVAWHYEAKGDDGAWVTIPGSGDSATLRFYGVLGNGQGTAAPNLPWVAVVDEATRAIAGKAKDAEGARAILVRYVNEEMGLSYDRQSGASRYTDYQTGYTNATFRLARFLSRSLGMIVNCSDCASILSTYANMIGADLHYAIIGFNFSLNPIRGIGSTTFGSPFNSGRMSFSYHAVVSSDAAAASIFDSTLAVDGDADPTAAPQTVRFVTAIPQAEYMTRLSGDANAGFPYVDKTTSVRF